jgi:hypothetical protein
LANSPAKLRSSYFTFELALYNFRNVPDFSVALRTLRQLNNHQLAKLKREKLKAEIRRLNGHQSGENNT